MRKLIALGLVCCLGCARGPGGPEGHARVTDSGRSGADEREVKVGREIHQAIVSSFRVYTEPRLVEYVNGIGQGLARSAERRNFPYQFTVLYDDRAYATEAPGGYVYLTTGFLNYLQNEAELAALLAYEVAGLQFRDPRFSLSQKAMNAVAQTGATIGPLFGQIGMLASTALVLLNAVSESRNDTPKERIPKVDQKALHLMTKAGFDPQGYLDFLGRLLYLSPEWRPYFYDYLTTRPVDLARYQGILEEFEKLPLEDRSFAVHRERYLEMTKGVREIYQR